MAEMYGKVDGCSRGRGGSMHLFDASRRFYGGNAIVAGHLPLAVGLALADAMGHRAAVTACFFGEGAMAEGEFHEAMNLAALWKLPVLFLCENNLYAMGTALARSESEVDLVRKAGAYGVPAERVDGMDVLACEAAVRRAAVAAREGGGPQFLEFRTYRFRAHSMFDAQLYRDKAEVEDWKTRDPIAGFEALLRAEGWLDDDDVAAVTAEVAAEVERSVTFAEGSAWEPVEELTRDVTTPRAICPAPPARTGGKTTGREALGEALREVLDAVPEAFLMGEDVGRYGGCYAVSKGLYERYGAERIRDTPLSESSFVGAGIGCALGGMRPIVEVMSVNFSMLALDQILNNAATLRHMSGGQVSVPVVIRMAYGAGRQLAAWIRATPSARHLARAESLDLASIAGTGHHGAVVRTDVERAMRDRSTVAAPPTPAPHPSRLSPMRQAIAAAMARSKREIPHYYLAHDIDLHHAHHWLAEYNATRPPAERVLPGALLVWAVARTLPRFPDLNGFWVDGEYRPAPGIHPGIAISLRGGGLVNPALHDADRLTPAEVMVGLGDLVSRARSGKLRGSEVTDGTLTITSLGDTGVETVFGVIQPPQVALVGFGRVTERPVAVDGMLAVRPVVTATLAGDHRASDGHRGALFLLAVDRQLQEIV